MNTERWQQVWKIFEDAVARPPRERAPYLDEACGENRQLRQAVEELLAADNEADSLLDEPVARMGGGAGDGRGQLGASIPAHRMLARGTRIGPYRILRRIGQGGMSTVYLAERADDAFPRRVAIKLVRPGLESEELLERLCTERRILASLDHPYVARLFDGGTLHPSGSDGLPYFVMEYVEGLPVDEYCEHNQLSVDERLELFGKICQSVHYAHQNLVIHRDIKPSNILVIATGDPRLLDFGIAKLLNPELGSADLEPTATWQRILTPNYASPEQIRGKLITTATDVYSLGVLLYQLLTGCLPRDFTGCSPHEIESLFSETEPPPPSAAIGQSIVPAVADAAVPAGSAPAAVAAEAISTAETATTRAWPESMPTPPAKLRRRLAGDLDAIVLKALRSAPQRRYGSVEQLAADIERYRAGLPVEARAGGWRYRAGKFVRRHRGALSAAAAVIMLVVGFGVAMTVQASRVARERDLARSERDQKAQVLALVRQLFESSDPYSDAHAQLTVREVLERSVPLMEHAVRDQPDVRAELLYTSGSILSLLGEPGDARGQLEEAFEIRRGLYGERHPDVVETMTALAQALKQLGEYDQAEELIRRTVEVARGLFDEGDPELVGPLNELVSLLCWRYQYDAAEDLAIEALALTEQLPEGDRRLAALEQMAIIRSSAGDHVEAVRLNREALALLRERYGEKHPAQVGTLNNLGLNLRRSGDFDGAEKIYREAIRLQREFFGKDDDFLLNNLAGVEMARGNYQTAEELYRAGRAVVVDTRGPESKSLFGFDVRIASAKIGQGTAAEAEASLRGLLEHWRPRLDGHWRFDHGTNILGHAVSVQGRCDEAEAILVPSFERLLSNTRDRVKRDALERLSEHLERCGKPGEIPRYAAMLDDEAS